MQNIIIEILDSISIEKDMKLLDFGCGDGGLVKYLNLQGYTTYGFDISLDAIEKAKEEFQKSELNPDLLKTLNLQKDRYKISNKEKYILPFEDNYFDCIYSFQVFEHIDNLEEVVAELSRILKDDGKIYLEFPSSTRLVEPHVMIPFVHFFQNKKLIYKYVQLFSYLKGIKDKKEYIEDTNHYLNNALFYRKHSEFDKVFENYNFSVEDYVYQRRKLRFLKDKVFSFNDLIQYKMKKYNQKSKLNHFGNFMNIYLKLHAFFYELFDNRALLITKNKKL